MYVLVQGFRGLAFTIQSKLSGNAPYIYIFFFTAISKHTRDAKRRWRGMHVQMNNKTRKRGKILPQSKRNQSPVCTSPTLHPEKKVFL